MTSPYGSRRWKQIRPLILGRDRYRCQIQLPGCRTHATEVDHIIDWQDGGPRLDPSNLRAACKSCNVGQRNQRVAARARAMRNNVSSRDW